MVLKPLGEKVVNILVNGTQEGSFTQQVTTADYDVSVDAVAEQSQIEIADVTWSTDQTNTNILYEFENDGSNSIDVLANMSTTDSDNFILEIRKNGNVVAGGTNTVPSETTVTLQSSDRLSLYAERTDQSLGNSEDYSGIAHILHTGSATLSVNDVTQS
jgi:hypothetical protein